MNGKTGRARLLGVVFSVMAALVALPGRADAADMFFLAFSPGTNVWAPGANWYDNAGNWRMPYSSDYAHIAYNAVQTCILDQPGAVCLNLDFGLTGTETIGTLIVTNGGALTVGPGTIVMASSGGGYVPAGETNSTGIIYQYDGSYIQTAGIAMGNVGDGIYHLIGGLLTNSGGVTMGYGNYGSFGTFQQSGGTNFCAGLAIGSGNSTGTYTMSGGILTNSGSLTIASSGVGAFRQSGGTNYNYAYIYLLNTNSTYELSGGLLVSGGGGKFIIDAGTFTQTGGTNDARSALSGHFVMGNLTGATGTYNLVSGTLMAPGAVFLGSGGAFGGNGEGLLRMGNATTSGVLHGGGFMMNYINTNGPGRGIISGWGSCGSPPTITMVRGSIIADGYGVSHTLDMGVNLYSHYSVYTNAVGGSGFSAVNRGKLLFSGPAKANAGSGDNYWPHLMDAPDDAFELVNGMKLTMGGAVAGTLQGALLASDHSSTPGCLVKPIGIWDFSTDTTNPVTFASCGLAIRYDAAAATNLSVDESALKVFQQVNGRWREITSGSVDTAGKTITANVLGTSLSQFAVAAGVKFSGTVITVR